MPERARVRTYSGAYKLRVLREYEELDKAGEGALLRREGLYSSLISQWRRQRCWPGSELNLATYPSSIGRTTRAPRPHGRDSTICSRRAAILNGIPEVRPPSRPFA
ncbi:MAG: hypothetical protein ACYCZN_07305 [Candidatus Dormibacteria bacterium]